VTVAIGVVTVAVGTVGVVTVTAVTGVLTVTVTGEVVGRAGKEMLGTCVRSDVVAWVVEAGDDGVGGSPLAARSFDIRIALVLDPPAAGTE
jgi:hypothetical protein